MVASVWWAWCFPSFLRSGLGAGEDVKLRRVPSSSFAFPAGRGGEGRSGRWSGSRFCCRWCSWFPPALPLWPTVVVRRVGSGGGVVFVQVVFVAGVAARSWVELRRCRCGRGRSSRLDSGALRRMGFAAFYNAWVRLLLSGRRSRIMKLKNSASGIYRETGLISVQRDYGVRPNKPDFVQTRCRWIIGDVTEVLDRNTWKLGKIAKIVENNYFIIRLADCIQLKEFHISSLRVPVQQDPPTTTVHCKQFLATDKVNRRGKQLPADLIRRSGKKRKSSVVLDAPPQPRHRRFMPEPRQRYQETGEETVECSVASCSANDDVARHPCCPVGRDDAMSVVAAPCTSSSSSSGKRSADDDGVLSLSDGPAMDVHELELEAYRSTVRALHASGPLTWEQESLLTNLRLSLNISNEEHLLQLRRLLSS